MEYRSSNAGQHLSNDFVSNVGSSHGVQLSGGSTGGIVQAVGDDASIALSLKAKGAGPVVIGDSSQSVQIAGSTAPFVGFYRFTDTAVATPNFATTNAMVMETTHVNANVSTGSYVFAQPQNTSTDCLLGYCYASKSTAGDVHCRWVKVSTLAVGASTATVDFLVFKF